MLLTDTQHEMPRTMKQRILHAYSVNNRRLIGSITSTTETITATEDNKQFTNDKQCNDKANDTYV